MQDFARATFAGFEIAGDYSYWGFNRSTFYRTRNVLIMAIKVQIEKITGLADDSASCGVFSKRVATASGDLGTLVSLILVKSNSRENSGETLTDIFEVAVKKLEEADSGSAVQNRRFLDVLKNAVVWSIDYAAGREVEASFVFAFFLDDVCYIAKAGEDVSLYIFEGKKFVQITFEDGSGPLRPGQIYLMATQSFLNTYDVGNLAQETEIDLEGIIDGLATEISAMEKQSEIGAVFAAPKADYVGESEQVAEIKQASELDENQPISDSAEVDYPDSDSGETQVKKGLKNPMNLFLKATLKEIGRLKRGDVGAIFRLRRNVVVLAIIVVLILVASGGFAYIKRGEKQKSLEFAQSLAAAEAKYSEGEGIVELNGARARELFIEAEKALKRALSVKPKDDNAKKLAEQIAARLKESEQKVGVVWETLVELDGELKSLGEDSGNVVGIGADRVVVVGVDRLTEEIKIEGVLTGFVFENKAYLVRSNEVVSVDLATEKIETIVKSGGAADLAVFFGNLYLLFADRIDKYVPVEGSYAGPTPYLNERSDFGSNARIAVDGSIWVSSGERIFKFTRGEKEEFEISGLVSKVGEFGPIYTNASADNLYVIDRENFAMLVVGKDGIYKNVYQSGEFANATDLIVNENDGKFYVAVGSKILEANLNSEDI